MSLRLVKAAVETELEDDFHLPRLLFLLSEADKRSDNTIAGIMKLAKLDFLLRYPNCLQKTLIHLEKKSLSKLHIKDHELTTIESKMIRFRYGPWDDRYRRWIGLLVSKGLAITYIEGKTIHIGITENGREVTFQLKKYEEFSDLELRSKLIYSAVGSLSATKLKNLIYEVFPEITNMKWGKEILL